MRKRNEQLIAYFLLLCLSLTLLPSTPFHSHEEASHLCEINEELEQNTCHVSVYHNEYQENHCEHNHHFSKSVEDCDFCEYVNSRRQLFTFNDYQFLLIPPFTELHESQVFPYVNSNRDTRILGRAPPII